METRKLFEKIEANFKSAVSAASLEDETFPSLTIKRGSLNEILSFCLHDKDMRFDYLECLTGMDTGAEIIIIYQLLSTALAHRLNIKVPVSYDDPKISSVTGFWRAALAYERETAEMLGVVFEGHPYLKPLLLAEGWSGYPLRKNYSYPEQYQGIEHRRPPLRKEHVKP